jgi:hypothetical protein
MRQVLGIVCVSCVLSGPAFGQSPVATTAGPGAAIVTEAPGQAADVQQRRGLLQVNPLGLLQVGPNLELQRMLSPGFAMGAGVRLISFGLLSHVLIEDLNFAWTATLNALFYPRKRMSGPFVGPRVEIGKSDRENYTANLLGGALEFGYRSITRSGLSVSIGGQAGVLNADYTHKTDAADTGTETYMFAMGVIGLGFTFP